MATTRLSSRESKVQNQISPLLISAAAGGLIGAFAALLLAPKSGQKFRQDIAKTYQDVSDKAHDFGSNLTEKGQSVASTLSEFADEVKDTASHLISPNGSDSNLPLLVGAIGGAILGATAIILMAPKEDESFTRRFQGAGKSVVDNLHSIDWYETAKEVVGVISDKVLHNGSKVQEEAKDKFNDVLEWASLGLQVWQNLKKRS